MGQRTMFYTVAINKQGDMKVSGYYSQWGIGRIMPFAVTSCIINNSRRDYEEDVFDGLRFDDKRQRFRLIFSEIYGEGQKVARATWADPQSIGVITSKCDNNNGAVVLYAKEKEGAGTEYRIGFLLGYEDGYYTYDGKEGNVEAKELGDPFSRWLTLEEWANLGCNKDYTEEEFLAWWKPFLKYFDVKNIAYDCNFISSL